MKLASLNNGTRDGQLVVVSRDLKSYADASSVVATMQAALDHWDDAEPRLRKIAAALEAGELKSSPFDPADALSPLPRAFQWADGSAYEGSWLDNKIHGFGEYRWKDGRVYQGDWLDSQMNGTGILQWPDGRCYEG